MALVSEVEFLKKIAPSLRQPLRLGQLSPTGCDAFDYDIGQPNLSLLMRFKQALARQYGVKRGFRIYRDTIPAHSNTDLNHRPLASQSSFAKSESIIFKELAPAGDRFALYPPEVLGPGNHRPLVGTTRSFYLACFRDAHVVGRSELVHTCGASLLDFQPDETDLLDDEVEFDDQIFSTDAIGSYIAERRERHAGVELDEAFHLLGAHSDFFGHWLLEYLQRLTAARLSGACPPVPILIDAHMPPSHRRSLQLMVGDCTPIVEVRAFENVFVRRLWCAPNLMYMPVHEKMNARFSWDYMAPCPERFAPVVREMCRRADQFVGDAPGPQRVFLARRGFRHRKLVNRENIEALAARRGFVVVYPEELDFLDQIRLVRRATHIIAPEGSALFLCFFAREGSKVAILNHMYTEALAIYNGLLESKGLALSVITGPVAKPHSELPHYSDYYLDENRFVEFMNRWA